MRFAFSWIILLEVNESFRSFAVVQDQRKKSVGKISRWTDRRCFVMKSSPEGYKTTMTLWDTDISFGKFGVTNLDFEGTVNRPMEREDTDSIRALHPDYDAKAYERWCQLRSGILSEENINAEIEEHMAVITQSGSLARDYAKWGITEDDADNLDTLKHFISERLPWADSYLAELAAANQ